MSGMTGEAPFHDAVTSQATQGDSYGTGATGATSDYPSGATSTGMDTTRSTGFDNTQSAGMDNTRDIGIGTTQSTGMDNTRDTGMDSAQSTGMDNTQSTAMGTSNTQTADLDNGMKPTTTAVDTTGLPSELATARTIGAKEAEDKAYTEQGEGKDNMDAHLSSISGPSTRDKDTMDVYIGGEKKPAPQAPAVSLDHLPSHETMAKLEQEVGYEGPGKNEKYY